MNRTLSAMSGLVAIALSVTPGCSSGDDADGSGSKQVSEAKLEQQLAVAYCEAGAQCCAAGGLPRNPRCVQERQQVYADQLEALRERKGEGAVYDADVAANCLKMLQYSKGFCMTSVDDGFLLPYGYCAMVYRSPAVKGPGESCTSSEECIVPEDGFGRCDFESGANMQICYQTVPVPDGQRCGQTNVPGLSHGCGPESYCDQTGSVCRPLPGLNEPCPSGKCRDWLVCESGCDYDEENSVCKDYDLGRERPDGAACTSDAHCAGGMCDTEYEVCRTTPTKSAGEPCGPPVQCISGSCSYNSLAKRSECDPLDPEASPMVNATTCNTDGAIE